MSHYRSFVNSAFQCGRQGSDFQLSLPTQQAGGWNGNVENGDRILSRCQYLVLQNVLCARPPFRPLPRLCCQPVSAFPHLLTKVICSPSRSHTFSRLLSPLSCPSRPRSHRLWTQYDIENDSDGLFWSLLATVVSGLVPSHQIFHSLIDLLMTLALFLKNFITSSSETDFFLAATAVQFKLTTLYHFPFLHLAVGSTELQKAFSCFIYQTWLMWELTWFCKAFISMKKP